MNDLWYSMVSIATAITGVAILAVLVSKNSNTAGVLQAAGGAYSTMLGTALSPVTGASPFGGVGSYNNVNVTGSLW